MADPSIASLAGGTSVDDNAPPESDQLCQDPKILNATKGVLDYLQQVVPRRMLLSLYEQEVYGKFVCRLVLQKALSALSQQVVIRLACVGGSFPATAVAVWIKQSSSRWPVLLRELRTWAVITTDQAELVTLTAQFAKGLKESLHSLENSPWTPLSNEQLQSLQEQQLAAADDTKASPLTFSKMSPEDLERYTISQWDRVLHFLVGTANQPAPPTAVIQFLLQTNLMQADPEYLATHQDEEEEANAPLVITQAGYDFMLQDNHDQVWHFVVQYLSSLSKHQDRGMILCQEAILLLISLSLARLGDVFLVAALKKDTRTIVKDLSLFGLLKLQKIGKVSLFYPTRVAMQLVGTASSSNTGSSSLPASSSWSLSSKALEGALAHPTPHDSSHLAIIVQTNFQLCAYTTSELHVSMLGLFCDVQTIRRLPNVVFMLISRDSIKAAFQLGIQAKQIIRFLEKHSHPKLRSSSTTTTKGSSKAALSTVPGNVIDQILLWDRERSRVQLTLVYAHICVFGAAEAAAVQKFAAEHNITTYIGPRSAAQSKGGSNATILIDHGHVQKMEQFVQQWRAARQQQ
jgi:Transcription factor Tfb2